MAAIDEKNDIQPTTEDGGTPSEAESVPTESVGLIARIKQQYIPKLLAFLKTRVGIITATVTFSLLATGVWAVLRSEPAEPLDQQFEQAMELSTDLHDLDNRQATREIVTTLRDAKYRDPKFTGGAEYLFGMVLFHDAQDQEKFAQQPIYRRSVHFLKQSKRSLPLQYRPQFAMAFGTGLYHIGLYNEAIPQLQEAMKTFPSGKKEASINLLAIYTEQKKTTELQKAVPLSEQLLQLPSLSLDERNRILHLKAALHLALQQPQHAQQAIEKISPRMPETEILHAQIQMAYAAEFQHRGEMFGAISLVESSRQRAAAQKQFQAALTRLEPISKFVRLDQTLPRQSLFLMGICAQQLATLNVENESLNQYDQAINYFNLAIKSDPQSMEGIAANIHFAAILQNIGRDEEAFQAYHAALSAISDLSQYRNRWLPLPQFRERILQAWKHWTDRHAYQMAVKLSTVMSPLIPVVQAQRLNGLANHRWVKYLANQLTTTPFSERAQKQQIVWEHWRLSGAAYAKLAEISSTSSKYPTVLWTSAEHYRNGHDFKNSLNQFTRFINLQSTNKLPIALVRRGQVLLDLGRFKEARDHFQKVITTFPTDTAAFEAKYYIGQCYLELGDVQSAETTWRKILTAERLAPAAIEWQKSLFSLGKLLYHSAVIQHDQAEQKAEGEISKQLLSSLKKSAERWEESRYRFVEYLERYPVSPHRNEARFLLAKSLQAESLYPQTVLKKAEVENVKLELRRKMYGLLQQARDEYRQLQAKLLPLEETGQLDQLGQQFLRDCYFEIAHTSFALDDYQKAITDYNSAANRYPQDPHVLLAYLQMAVCNDRLGQPAEALSTLVQAKVILKKLPEKTFSSERTNLSKKEWETWLDWARKIRTTTRRTSATIPSPIVP